MRYKNLNLVGTSHIAIQSVKDVEAAIEEDEPSLVAIELDKRRLLALGKKESKNRISFREIRRLGVKGFLFGLVGAYVEKKLGNLVGMKPGGELLKAVQVAKKKNIPIALIDQDIEVTLRKFGKALTWKEKFRFGWDLLKATITRKPEVSFDLRQVPSKEIIKQLTNRVKERYPSVYKVLIEDRNKIMAKRLAILMKTHEKENIVAVVGAGHEEEMVEIIKGHLQKSGLEK